MLGTVMEAVAGTQALLDEYNAIQETLHLQKSPGNARRLQASIAQLDAGEGSERDVDP